MENQIQEDIVSSGVSENKASGNGIWVYVAVLLVAIGLVVAMVYWYSSKQNTQVSFEEATPRVPEGTQDGPVAEAEVVPVVEVMKESAEIMDPPVTATYTMNELTKVKQSEKIFQQGYISLAGEIGKIEGDTVTIRRQDEFIVLQLNPTTQVRSVPIRSSSDVELSDFAMVIKTNDPLPLPQSVLIDEVAPGSKAQFTILTDEAGVSRVASMQVYQVQNEGAP